ncbi:MAG TPA: hypothetical protein VFZ64_10375 [Nocardioidaceae bacterium]
MSVAKKLQIKQGQQVAVLGAPADVVLDLDPADLVDDAAEADAVVLFVRNTADLSTRDGASLVEAARRDALAWVAYPKAGRLGTDLNRDSLNALLVERGARGVRQIAIDVTWSALRFRPVG